ncbi:probable F-box protein At2g36090 [Phragmites australis]|uniref:probable F-box protein At2g36090 n=1 Tax=Phragmites australis TaxID=29695 RepID=UPI002D784A7E|nr:probable F-box protein At2g36090 [Phragmites australis]
MVTTIEDLHADVLARALRRLDGRSLAAASCATAGLRALAADPETWRALCLAEWPSLAGERRLLAAVPPHRLFADAFPFPSPDAAGLGGGEGELELPGELVSAVDVYCRGAPLLSRVVETPASSSWFLGSPFRVEAVEHKKPALEAVSSPAELELSWVVVDPARGRAVNVSSRRAVAVDRHWYTGETMVRFAVVLGGCKFEATVTCSEGAGHVNEVSLAVEDADGAAVSGEGTLRLLAAAMEGQRRGGEKEPEEAKRRYEEFVKRKKGRKESKARREALLDLCCSVASAVVVLTFLGAVALR